MRAAVDFKGNNRKEEVFNAKKEGLNFLVTVANSNSDWEYYFKTEEEAINYCVNECDAHPDFIEEKCTIWDLNDEMSNEVLFED